MHNLLFANVLHMCPSPTMMAEYIRLVAEVKHKQNMKYSQKRGAIIFITTT